MANATLKIKNGGAGEYRFQYRHPESGKLAIVVVPPISTREIMTASVDVCSSVRLQYPLIPDNSDAKLFEAGVQFVWDLIEPTLEDYEGSLATIEQQGADEGKAAIEEAVNQSANSTAESMPDALSTQVLVQKGKEKIKAGN